MTTGRQNFTRTEVMAGFLVLTAVATLLVFVAVVLGLRPPRPMKEYHGSFTKIIGLNPGAEVRFGGVRSGYVSAIAPDPEDQALIRVTVAVEESIPVNEDSVATIEQVSLTSEKHLEISTGSTDAQLLPPHGRLKTLTLGGGFVELPELGSVITRVERLLDDVVAFLGVDLAMERESRGEAAFTRLTDIASAVSTTLDEGSWLLRDGRGLFAREEGVISDILKKITVIEDTAQEVVAELADLLRANRPALEQGAGHAVEMLASGRELVDKVVEHSEDILFALHATLENTGGLTEDARLLLEQNRPAIEQSIADTRQAIRHLREFSRTMAEEPHAVIRGKRPVGR